jgi:hypothetical protein
MLRSVTRSEDRARRARTWLEAQEPAVEGQGGDERTYAVCCAVTVGHDLDEDSALAAMKDWNARCKPQWKEKELRSKLRNAIKYATEQRGGRLKPTLARSVVLTCAADFKPQRVLWLWDKRLPRGMLALLAGREGLGKSSIALERGARITRGQLEGDLHGVPKSVIVVATEDSWEHTIVPRLMAAGADLKRVFRANVAIQDAGTYELSLPWRPPSSRRKWRS